MNDLAKDLDSMGIFPSDRLVERLRTAIEGNFSVLFIGPGSGPAALSDFLRVEYNIDSASRTLCPCGLYGSGIQCRCSIDALETMRNEITRLAW